MPGYDLSSFSKTVFVEKIYTDSSEGKREFTSSSQVLHFFKNNFKGISHLRFDDLRSCHNSGEWNEGKYGLQLYDNIS